MNSVQSVQFSYARLVKDDVAIEGAIDVVGAAHHSFAVTTLQARRVTRTEMGPVPAALGLAYSSASGEHPSQPQGLGWVIGGALQPRFTRHLALRAELQLFGFRRDRRHCSRISLGVLVGR